MRRRLVLLAAANTIMVALAFLVPLGVLVRTLARDRALNAAEIEAQSLAPALSLTQDASALAAAVGATTAGAEGRLTIFLPDGAQVGAPVPGDPAKDDDLALARRGRAFSAGTEGGMQVLVPVVLARGSTAVVRVFVPDSTLARGVVSAWVVETAVGVALVALAVILADRMARTIVRPVKDLAGAAAQLGEGDLSVRIEPSGPPEIVQAAVAFNRLGSRVGELLAAERELVADLSHRLRTPLTALRLDADAIADPETSQRILDDADELERQVTAIIHQARRPVRTDMGPRTDAAAMVRERLEFWAPLAEDQSRTWSFECGPEDEGFLVAVGSDELEAALDALLGNVFSHTPEGTPFRVGVRTADNGATCLVVEDEGPGLEAALISRGVSGTGSTGLGLDIVRRTAEGAGGALRVTRSATGGARVELEFPPTP